MTAGVAHTGKRGRGFLELMYGAEKGLGWFLWGMESELVRFLWGCGVGAEWLLSGHITGG